MNIFSSLTGIPQRAAGAGALAATLTLAVACGSATGAASGDPGAPKPSALTISVAAHQGATPRRVTLTCAPAKAGGTHPEPQAACTALARAKAPFAPVPAGIACSMIYSGPQTASITGTWDGKRVSATYSRDNGCQTARWNKIAPVLNGINPGGPMIPAAG